MLLADHSRGMAGGVFQAVSSGYFTTRTVIRHCQKSYRNDTFTSCITYHVWFCNLSDGWRVSYVITCTIEVLRFNSYLKFDHRDIHFDFKKTGIQS